MPDFFRSLMNGNGQPSGKDDADQSAHEQERPSPTPDSESSSKDRPVVPDYELLRRIGRGAYGEVWLARSQATGALRAAKIVWRQTFEDAKPFQREFAGIQRFERISREHPSQLALFHIGRNEPGGYFYYVMELADQAVPGPTTVGSDVHIALRRAEDSPPYQPHTLRADLGKGRLPAAKALEIGLALSEALAHLHSNGLVHRDVKPSNVIFVNGRPKLADIGLVTDASDQCSIVGTEGYLPPEGPGTPQADIFALGKVLYEAATGRDRREFPKLPEDLRAWPDRTAIVEFNEIVLRACAQNAERRYLTCDEMHADLSLLVQGKSVKQKRARQQRWAVVKKVFVTSAVFGVVAASVTIFWRQPRVTRPLSSSPEAVGLYQQALYELKGDTFERRQQAYTNLVEAVRLDPGFVDAYYQMFEVYFDAFGDKLPPHYNQLANWRAIAEKLRQVAPNSVQYHTVNSLVKFWDWKFDDAIEESMLAIKLDPKFLRAHGVYADEVLLAHGDADTALREFGIAERIDRSDVIIQTLLGDPFNMQRKFDQAIEQCSRAVQLEPRATVTHANLGNAYASAKQYDKAIDEYEQFDLLNGRDPEQTKAWYEKMRSALHEKGPRGWWQAQLDEAKKDPHADPYWMAQLCARLGDTNEVFSLLDRAYREHSVNLQYLLLDDCWDPFRDDPRLQELVKKMGFHPIPGVVR